MPNPPHTSDRIPAGCGSAQSATGPADRGPGLPEQVGSAIRRYRAGDREAMTDLVRIVSPWLHGLARGIGLSQYSAEDVVQSTLLALLRRVDSIRSPEAGLAWLAVTARREAIKVSRAERSVELVSDMGADEACPSAPGPEAVTIDGLCRTLLWRHVGTLPTRGQQVLQEIAHGGRPDYATISEQTGMPLGSIGPTRGRSLMKIRRLLEMDPDWVAFATAAP